ncbi:MAG: TolB-like protein/DNA-binding winged helix-turn-helix (wHTH) protein [Phenylobacterium sp.]|jgi:TolB-like protein/DNA-binding winged helix-turn-helix (wHTH) protein
MTDPHIRPIDANGLCFDQENMLLFRDQNKIKLDAGTARLLSYFLDNPGIVLSRDQLIDQVWTSQFVSDNAINRNICTLRKALGGNINQYITTIPKVGYRFNDLVTAQAIEVEAKSEPEPEPKPALSSDDKIPVALTSTQPETQPDPQLNKVRWSPALSLLTLIAIIVYFFVNSFLSIQPSHDNTASPTTTDSINIAVLPFANLSAAQNQQVFVDGLTEELFNVLTRIPGLHVVGGPVSHADIDAKQTAEALGVQYLLRGSVNKTGDNLRINVHLIAAQSGRYLFSTRFDRQLSDSFTIQAQISEQVAAALKLSLIYKDNPYSSALTKMDHTGVEQLVIARAQMKEQSVASLIPALASLKSLNQRFPDTPEVMGLMAYISRIITKNQPIKNEHDFQQQEIVALAQKVLMLDQTNLDALKTLYYYYTDFAHLREQAYPVSEAILRYHPGQTSAWRSRLHLMIKSFRPCEEIRDYVNSIPTGVFTNHRLRVIESILRVCLQSEPLDNVFKLKTFVSPAKLTKAINNNLYFFAVRADVQFEVLQKRARQSSNQHPLSEYYWAQLAIGDKAGSAATAGLINRGEDSFWRWLSHIYSALYAIPDIEQTDNEAGFKAQLASSINFHYFSAALILQAKADGNTQHLSHYLNTMAEFPITLFNTNEAIGLMMLQYHGNRQRQSQANAKTLFDKLEHYRQTQPQSYLFWGLGGKQLVAGFYCGTQCDIDTSALEQWFKADYAWWLDDIGFTRLALSPWENNPVVIEYLARIEQDRSRAAQKFGL